MAITEVPQVDQGGFGRRVFLNRYVVAPLARAAVVGILTTPISLTARAGEQKMGQARAAASEAFQDPTPPSTSPELRAVAREENDLLIQRQGAESIGNNIKPSNNVFDLQETEIARKAFEEDKAARVQALNDELRDLQQSPRFRTAIDGYKQNQQSYRQNLENTRASRSTEQSRLEAAAGLTLPERILGRFSTFGTVVLQYGAAIAASGVPFGFRRGAWPFPERAQVLPEPHGEEEA